jgi:formate-dependent nitrite reductase cytochrome c552 subunit
MSPTPFRDVLVRFSCDCGKALEIRTDRAARPHMRTVQCKDCKVVYYVRTVITRGQ